MRFDPPRHVRQSMSWLHTGSGLFLGWLLFAIFVTGSLSFFRNEINVWMRPELHRISDSVDSARLITYARRVLEQKAPDSPQWQIVLPGPRVPIPSVLWRVDERAVAGEAGVRGHAGRSARLFIDPSTGEVLKMRQTAGADFLFRFHFQLYGLDILKGRWIVGAAAMVMFIALLSGLIIHRAVFRDFFTFRPNKGKRSWLDAHVLAGMAALPFHLMISFSGLLLLGAQLMQPVANSFYSDARAFVTDWRGGNARASGPQSERTGKRAPLADLVPLFEAAKQQWRERPPEIIIVNHPGDSGAHVEIRQAYGNNLADRALPKRLFFDGTSGEMIRAPEAKPPSAILSVWNTLTTLHMGRFATPIQRWLLFLGGVCGACMIASGLILWRISRFGKQDRGVIEKEQRPVPLGYRGVEVLNVSGIAGLLLALGVYFWGSRILPLDLASRLDWEPRLFFMAWSVSLLHAVLTRHISAWVEQLAFSGILFALLPLLNGLTGGMPLFRSIALGCWQVAGVDLCAMSVGVGLLFAAWKVHEYAARKGLEPEKRFPACIFENRGL